MISQKYVLRLIAALLAVTLIAQTWAFAAGQSVSQIASPNASPEAQQDDRSIAFYPEDTGFGSFITVELEAGKSVEKSVVVGNTGNVEQTLRSYAIPAKSGINGGFVLSDYGVENDEITGWLDYPEQQFTFAPGEGANIPVKISVPEGTAPGEYVTSLAAEQAGAFAIEGTDMSSQRVRWSVPILIVVPGELTPAFEIGNVQLEWLDGSVYGLIEIANTGNTILNPTGEVRLLDPAGKVVGVSAVEMQALYVGTSTMFVVSWQAPQELEDYGLEVVMTEVDGSVTVEKSFEEIVPAADPDAEQMASDPLVFSTAEMTSLTKDNPPSTLQFEGAITNNAEPIEEARVSIVTYKDGEEVDRYPIMQAVTLQTGTTPVEARYSLPGGFTEGTYTFEVTIELGDSGTQTVLVTQAIDLEIVVP